MPRLFFECPNFVKLCHTDGSDSGKWVLLFSPNSNIEYIVGSFDTQTLEFTEERAGVLDVGFGPDPLKPRSDEWHGTVSPGR